MTTSRFILIPLVIASALFMENMDGTVIATSLPAIAVDLRVDPILLKLAFTSYLLSLAVFIPVSGWFADRFGARTVFRAAIVVFTLGSIACAFTDSLAGFVAARALQGLGGAMMVPVGRLVLLRSVPKSELVRALAYLTIPAMVGPVVGPLLGGFITTYFHWRWIFWINVPIGIIGIVLATLYIPDLRETEKTPLDAVGFVLTGAGLSCFIFGLTVMGREFMPLSVAYALLAVGAVLLAVYVWHARRVSHPVIDLRLLRIPTFRTCIYGGFLFRVGIGALPFLLPLLLQLGFGLSAFASGSLTFVAAAGAMAMKFSAGPILKQFGFRQVLIVNGCISTAFLAATALFSPSTPHLLIMLVLLGGGFFRSLQFTSLNAVAFADIAQADMSRATSFTSVAQQLSGAVGVAVGAMALELTQHLRGDPTLVAADFGVAFVVVALISFSSIFFHWGLPRDAGNEVSGHMAQARRPVQAE